MRKNNLSQRPLAKEEKFIQSRDFIQDSFTVRPRGAVSLFFLTRRHTSPSRLASQELPTVWQLVSPILIEATLMHV